MLITFILTLIAINFTLIISTTYRQCMAVYDEKCMTSYPAKCVKEQTCTMVYRTMCEMEMDRSGNGYNQQCRQMPSESCVPVTKCHRVPKTQCKPIKEKECGDVEVQVPVRQMVYKCQPFEPRKDENLDECMGMMAGNDMYAPPLSSLSDGYGPPQALPIGSNGISYGPPGGVTPDYGAITTSGLLPLTQQQQQLPNSNVDPGLFNNGVQPVSNTYTSSQQVPNNAQFPAQSQTFNSDTALSQALPNSYTSSQNINAQTQNFAQTFNNNNNNNNNIIQSTYSGSQQQFQQQQPQNINTATGTNYNSGTSSVVQQQISVVDAGNGQQPLSNYGNSGLNQQPVLNSYSTNTVSQTPLLTPQVQLQQPFINANNQPQTFSAPSSYISPLSSNSAVQTPFAPNINSNSNNQGDLEKLLLKVFQH